MQVYIGKDGLSCFQDLTGRQAEITKKKICKLFEENGLKITIDANLKVTDFLDVTFNLKNGKYYPYRKPNNEPLYINAQSNHPPSILKEIPNMISKRVSEISCDKEQFEKAIPMYQKSLDKSGYKSKLKFVNSPKPKRNRKRKIIWFNPPYSSHVKTNIGKVFRSLIEKHFTRSHKYYKIFNKNSIKLSYSCMPSMKCVIDKHNSRLLKQDEGQSVRLCNCPNIDVCPLNGECLKRCFVYNAKVESASGTTNYIGVTEGPFKGRLSSHELSFRDRKYETSTKLSTYVWKLRDKNEPYTISWSVMDNASPYACGTRKCDLCITEKLHIAKAEPGSILNMRSELVAKCRHRKKFSLKYLNT